MVSIKTGGVMQNFIYENKSEIHFGDLPESHIAECIKKFEGKNVLLHFGGGSIVKSGLHEKIMKTLTSAGLHVVELGGVRPNPSKSLAQVGIELARKEKVDFVLAVGGGSVIDSAKCIAAGANNIDIWDYYDKRKDTKLLKDVLPIGAVLTIPAAGSECSPTSVIRYEDGGLKYTINSESLRPKFAFINPAYSSTLPANQIAYGVSDIFAHLFERFFAEDSIKNAIVTDKILIGAMHAVLKLAPKVYKDFVSLDAKERNGDHLANLCLIGTLAHNSMLNMGRGSGCWASHRIDNRLLSGVKDIAHGAGLAIAIPAYLKFMSKKKPARVEHFTREVISISGLEKFYKTLELPTRLSHVNLSVDEIKPLVKLAFPVGELLGGYGQLTIEEIETIIEIAK